MNKDVVKILAKLKRSKFAKIVYQCEECENIVFRTIGNTEIKLLIQEYNKFEPAICGVCNRVKLIIQEVVSERAFNNKYPDCMSGG